MRIKISKAAIRRYIELLQNLETSDPASDSVELDFALLSPVSLAGRPAQLHEMMYADYAIGPDVELSVPPANGGTARRLLKSKLRDAELLTICDPYLLDEPKGENAGEYVRQLISVLPLDSLRSLDIVYDKSKEHPAVVRELKHRLPKHISLRLIADDSIHDRVWIIDGKSAYVVGTSFGGLGKRLAFLLSLPYDDLANFKKYLFRSKRRVS